MGCARFGIDSTDLTHITTDAVDGGAVPVSIEQHTTVVIDFPIATRTHVRLPHVLVETSHKTENKTSRDQHEKSRDPNYQDIDMISILK